MDKLGKVIMDELIKPSHPVLDMNSRFSGITSLEDAKLDLEQARDKFLELVNRDTIVVGQSLENDFKVLRLIHTRVIDTAMVRNVRSSGARHAVVMSKFYRCCFLIKQSNRTQLFLCLRLIAVPSSSGVSELQVLAPEAGQDALVDQHPRVRVWTRLVRGRQNVFGLGPP